MIVDRILKIIELKKINKSIFYKETGLSNGFLDKVNDIGSSKIEHILKIYPDINPIWLLMGEGEIFKNEEKKEVSAPITGQNTSILEQENAFLKRERLNA
jgi:hypothetical protein